MRLLTTTVPSPIGTLRLVGDGSSLTGVYMEDHRPAPRLDDAEPGRCEVFGLVVTGLDRYFSGEEDAFENVPIELRGTDFQRRVWTQLRTIPYGTTTTYGDLARRLGRPSASRAVGAATGRNPVSIVVPCHRVVGASGSLTGFAGGVARKRALLDLEAGSVKGRVDPAHAR